MSMHEPSCKAAVLLLSIRQSRRARLIAKMSPERARAIRQLLETAEQLHLVPEDFTRLKLPVTVFNCCSSDEVNWLREHAIDSLHRKMTQKTKQTFLHLLNQRQESA